MAADSQSAMKLSVWPKAYVHGVETALRHTFNEELFTAAYRNAIQSNEASVTKMVMPSFRITVLPGKLTLTLDNASISVHHQKRHEQYEEDYEKHVSGSLEVTVHIVRPAPLYDPMYCVNVKFVDLLFTYSSRNSIGNGFVMNGSRICINGACVTGTGIIGNGVCINGGIVTSGPFSFNSTDFHSMGTGSRKRSASPVDGNAKRSRHIAPLVYSGMDQRIKSTEDDASVTISGIDQHLTSSGRDAVIVASGVDSVVVSSGERAYITSSGVDGSVTSTGSHATIRSSGCDATIKSHGPHASIRSSGTDITIHSSGANALISSSGIGTTIKSTGSQASISCSGTNTRIQSSGSAINDHLGKTLIDGLTNALTECLNGGLPDTSLDGGGSREWVFQNGYLEDSEDQDIPFPEPQNSGRMLTMFISNAVIDKVGSSYHRNNILNYNIKQADLNPQATRNNPASGDSRCLADCFPDFSVKYPGASVEVKLSTVEAPTATFSDENLIVTLRGSAIFQARHPDGSLVDFLTTEVAMESTVLLELNVGKLKGTLTSMLPKSIAVVKNALGCVNRNMLKDVFDLITEQFLRRKLEEIIQTGIPLPLPLLAGIEDFETVELSTQDDFLRIDADFTFRA